MFFFSCNRSKVMLRRVPFICVCLLSDWRTRFSQKQVTYIFEEDRACTCDSNIKYGLTYVACVDLFTPGSLED